MPGSPGRFLTGAIAGLVATLPMTMLMAIGKRRLSWQSQEPLPAREITRGVLQTVNLDNEVSFNQEMVLTAVNHFAYGAGAGAAYGGLFPSRSLAGAVSTGIVYGLGVWTGSYFGWLPALGLYRSPAEDTAERNRLMIAAHLVWGGSLGLVTHYFPSQQRDQSPVPALKFRPTKLKKRRKAFSHPAEITP